jgi:hypothetical protein
VNGLQYEIWGYPGVGVTTMRVPVPEDPRTVTENTILDAIPTVQQTFDILRATYGFSTQLDVMGDNIEIFHDQECLPIVRKFREKLYEVDKQIRERDSRRPDPYLVSMPEMVPGSINA